MSSPPENWLEIPGKPAPPSRQALAVRKKQFPRTEGREKLAQHLRQLTVMQRLWLKACALNSYDSKKARQELRKAGVEAPKHWTISRWQQNPNYVAARDIYEAMVYEQLPSKTTLLMRINKISEFNSEIVDEFHQGEPTGRSMMRDSGAALKATEMLAKEKKMFGEEHSNVREGPQLVVQVIVPTVDGGHALRNVTPHGVQVRRAADDDVIDAEPADGSS